MSNISPPPVLRNNITAQQRQQMPSVDLLMYKLEQVEMQLETIKQQQLSVETKIVRASAMLRMLLALCGGAVAFVAMFADLSYIMRT